MTSHFRCTDFYINLFKVNWLHLCPSSHNKLNKVTISGTKSFERFGQILKIVYSECSLKFPGEGLAAVDITTPEGHFQIQDIYSSKA